MPKLYYALRVSLVLLGCRRRSPTYTIRERRTDMYAFTEGMCIPNTDDEAGRENKRCSIDKEL